MGRVKPGGSTAGGITPEHTAAVEFLKKYPAIVQEALAAALKSLGSKPPEDRKWRAYPAELVLRAHEDVPETSRNPDDGDKAPRLRTGDTEYRADNIFVSEEEDPILHALIAEVQRKTAGKMPQSLLTVALAGVRLACNDVQLLAVTFKDSIAKQLSKQYRIDDQALTLKVVSPRNVEIISSKEQARQHPFKTLLSAIVHLPALRDHHASSKARDPVSAKHDEDESLAILLAASHVLVGLPSSADSFRLLKRLLVPEAKARLIIMTQKGAIEEADLLDKMLDKSTQEGLEKGLEQGLELGFAQGLLLGDLKLTYPELQNQELLSQVTAGVRKLDLEQVLEVKKHLDMPFEQLSAVIVGLKKDTAQHSDAGGGSNKVGPADRGPSKKDNPGST